MKRHFLSLVVLGMSLSPVWLRAADNTSLAADIASLKAMIQSLEARIEKLEGSGVEVALASKIAEQAGPQAVVDEPGLVERVINRYRRQEEDRNFPWIDAVKWAQLHMGMSEAEVIAILGEQDEREPSLHKRIDIVLTYKGVRPTTGEKVIGKVKFYKDEVVVIEAPEID